MIFKRNDKFVNQKRKGVISGEKKKNLFKQDLSTTGQVLGSWTATGQVLDSWTATGQVWTCLDSDFLSNFARFGSKTLLFQNDNRILRHLTWF